MEVKATEECDLAWRKACPVKQLEEKVAVVTGAASGIGRALVRRCAAERMKIVLADVEPAALTALELEVRKDGATALGVLTDVSNPRDVEQLSERTVNRFGAVHLLFNNAGVGMIGPAVWESTIADWSWILGVNLWGVIHGLRVFIPLMLEQATECHIVNTASAAGLLPQPGMGVYSASKAAVIALTEAVQHELAIRRAQVRVSVVCPGPVKTRMIDAARNRPAALQNDPWVETERQAAHAEAEQELRSICESGMSPDEVAELSFAALSEHRMHTFTHPWISPALELRMSNILKGIDPWTGLGSKEPEA
jgi:NAD(P)-dependent dehydrogenase (short-subunit alcohol dehydrogenase family)